MSKELDDLIEAKGWRKGQSVKLGYDDIEEYTNQKVITELEAVLKFNMELPESRLIPVISAAQLGLATRIQNLKQDDN